ncbi:MAG TPA: transposase [bacterium]|nr:transposase [bacterium]HPN44622.1 transposase [bacterium]
MTQYQRLYIPGGTYFFTLVTYNRRRLFDVPDARQVLKEVWKSVQTKYPFTLDAFCLLPDHLHCMWTLPENDSQYSKRWNLIKGLFSKKYQPEINDYIKKCDSRIKKQEATFWQRRFWEHYIRDEDDFEKHFDYIHYNPVKHGYVKNPIDWEWSTFAKYLHMGNYEPDWGVIESKQIIELKSTGE